MPFTCAKFQSMSMEQAIQTFDHALPNTKLLVRLVFYSFPAVRSQSCKRHNTAFQNQVTMTMADLAKLSTVSNALNVCIKLTLNYMSTDRGSEVMRHKYDITAYSHYINFTTAFTLLMNGASFLDFDVCEFHLISPELKFKFKGFSS